MHAVSQKRAREPGRGRGARHPAAMPMRGWRDIMWRIFNQIGQDRVMLIAAGVTFYMLLALFPALAAFVSVYGFVADPTTVADHLSFLGGILPTGAYEMIDSQLESLSEQEVEALSFGFISGFAIALWSANNGIKSLFEAMNVAYGETEKRSFLMLNLVSLAFTLGAVAIGVFLIVSVGLVPAALSVVRLEGMTEILIRLFRWPLLLVAVFIAITLIYRYGPSREEAKWRWLTWGATLATVVWLISSIAFSWYLENFANYNATYGTLGATIGFMMWIWISAMILIVGAEINAELEHQTAVDTTTGEPAPLGSRGAYMADTVGRARKGE